MTDLVPLPDGGYAFLRGVFPYSQGVRALDGFAIERVRFARPLPVPQGFAAIEAYLGALGRPKTALCAAELRSPQAFTMDGFVAFNRGYVEVLKQWGLFRAGLNPVARSNVAPQTDPPSEPSFYAFCHTLPVTSGPPSFVVAGSGEWPEGGRYPEDIVARGDLSREGLRTKARWVMAMMEQRMAGLGVSWHEATAVQVYTVRDIEALLTEEILPRTGRHLPARETGSHGDEGHGRLTWHRCRPPIEGLEYEMDVRGVVVERLLPDAEAKQR
jgi:hypothetical protein